MFFPAMTSPILWVVFLVSIFDMNPKLSDRIGICHQPIIQYCSIQDPILEIYLVA